MATVIKMPRLSDTMTEGTVATWLKKVGDKIKEGDILAEIETDKATMEFESFNSGTLLHIGIPEGETAPVDSLLAIIGEEGEDISSLLACPRDGQARRCRLAAGLEARDIGQLVLGDPVAGSELERCLVGRFGVVEPAHLHQHEAPTAVQ